MFDREPGHFMNETGDFYEKLQNDHHKVGVVWKTGGFPVEIPPDETKAQYLRETLKNICQ
jgi:flavodoxin